MAATGIGLAMKYFGRKTGQTLVEFRNEYARLSPQDKADLTKGLEGDNPTYTY
jgi:hypothetical protein